MQKLMQYPFIMRYMPGREALIGMVEALSRAPYEDASALCSDPLDLQYLSINRDQGQTSHEACFVTQALSSEDPCPYNPLLQSLYNTALEDEEYMEIVNNVVAGHKWSAYKNKPLHPVRRWGRALFELLSITRDRQAVLTAWTMRTQDRGVVARKCFDLARRRTIGTRGLGIGGLCWQAIL